MLFPDDNDTESKKGGKKDANQSIFLATAAIVHPGIGTSSVLQHSKRGYSVFFVATAVHNSPHKRRGKRNHGGKFDPSWEQKRRTNISELSNNGTIPPSVFP